MVHRPRFQTLAVLIGVITLMLLGGCQEIPTTLVVNVIYDQDDRAAPPVNSWLYLRLMLQDGTVTWSNEAAPYAITDLADGKLYRYILTPTDAILTDPADLYMFDAYFYSADLSPALINPENGGDAARFTMEAVPDLPIPQSPYYDPAPHLATGIQILPGTQKHIHLKTIQIFP